MQLHVINYIDIPLDLRTRIKLFADEILFFEADVNYSRIHFKSGRFTIIARTLLYIQDRTKTENFVRVSRKHLVNAKFITSFIDDFVVLSDKTMLPIARRRKQAILTLDK
jgi:two-component system LytT family response regulator